MSAAATALAVYSAQILLIVIGVASLAAAVVKLPLPAARLRDRRAVLGLCLLLPAIPDFGAASGPAATVTFEMLPGAVPPGAAVPPSWTPVLLAAVPWLAAAGGAIRLLWLVVGGARLHQLRRRSRPPRLGSALDALWIAGPEGRRTSERRHRAAGDVRLAAAGRAAPAALRHARARGAARRPVPRAVSRPAARLARYRRRGAAARGAVVPSGRLVGARADPFEPGTGRRSPRRVQASSGRARHWLPWTLPRCWG